MSKGLDNCVLLRCDAKIQNTGKTFRHRFCYTVGIIDDDDDEEDQNLFNLLLNQNDEEDDNEEGKN